jgi:hypothetical protein
MDKKKHENSKRTAPHTLLSPAPAFALFGEVKLGYGCVTLAYLTLQKWGQIAPYCNTYTGWMMERTNISFYRRTDIALSASTELQNNLYHLLV